jgi:hypothetical protein
MYLAAEGLLGEADGGVRCPAVATVRRFAILRRNSLTSCLGQLHAQTSQQSSTLLLYYQLKCPISTRTTTITRVLKRNLVTIGLSQGESEYLSLTFRNPASYIKDGHTATLNTPHFLYFFNKYTY